MNYATKRLLDAANDSLTAWEGEEYSVREEHAEMIEELESAIHYFNAHGIELRYCVDGREFDTEDSPYIGDGKFGPFVVFNIEEQDNEPGHYDTREEAQKEADRLNREPTN